MPQPNPCPTPLCTGKLETVRYVENGMLREKTTCPLCPLMIVLDLGPAPTFTDLEAA